MVAGAILLLVAGLLLVLVLPTTFEALAMDGHGLLPRTSRANGPAWWIAFVVSFCAALAAGSGVMLIVSGARRIRSRPDLESESERP